MRLDRLHDWKLTPEEAVALQQDLRARVVADSPIDLDGLRLVAGVDVSVKANRSRAAVVVLSLPELRIVETATAEQDVPFPYVPGLLSFREGPVLEEAFAKLERTPDAFLFDGQGIAHPRRIGIASHMGLWLQRPTIGCGKTRLVGRHKEPAPERGARTPLVDRGETIGAVLRTRERVAPIYVSPGHLADIDSAVELVLRLTTRYRLPEPIRAAHNAAGAFTPDGDAAKLL